jgi:hypothetical protein
LVSNGYNSFRNSNPEAPVVEVVPVSLLTQKSPLDWGDLSPPTKQTFRCSCCKKKSSPMIIWTNKLT